MYSVLPLEPTHPQFYHCFGRPNSFRRCCCFRQVNVLDLTVATCGTLRVGLGGDTFQKYDRCRLWDRGMLAARVKTGERVGGDHNIEQELEAGDSVGGGGRGRSSQR